MLTKRSRENDFIGHHRLSSILQQTPLQTAITATTRVTKLKTANLYSVAAAKLLGRQLSLQAGTFAPTAPKTHSRMYQNKKQSNLKVQNQIHGLAADRGEEGGQVFTDDELISRDIAQWSASKAFTKTSIFYINIFFRI